MAQGGSATSSRAAHLAGRSGRPGDRPIADHPAQSRIATQPIGVVHVLVAGQPPKHRLTQQAGQPMATILAGARVGQRLGTRAGQAQRIIQLAAGQQPGVGGDRGAAELQQQTTVEIEPQSALSASPVGSAIAAPVIPPQHNEF